MPQCKKCGNQFPNRIRINGVLKTLGNRKYCLDCSPWGQHNTAKIHEDGVKGVCVDCGRTFIYDRNSGNRRTVCTTCIHIRRRKKTKQRAVEYMGGKCQLCGYDRFYGALEFHHKDPSLKKFEIGSEGYKYKWETLKAELDKCVMLCSTCHREVEGGYSSVE